MQRYRMYVCALLYFIWVLLKRTANQRSVYMFVFFAYVYRALSVAK